MNRLTLHAKPFQFDAFDRQDEDTLAFLMAADAQKAQRRLTQRDGQKGAMDAVIAQPLPPWEHLCTQIIAYLGKYRGRTICQADVRKHFGASASQAENVMRRLRMDGRVVRAGKHDYTLP